MKLSGHNFNNDTFSSLLDGLSKDIELKKTAQAAKTPEVNEFFSATTSSNMDDIRREELDFIANELTFAADKARIAVNAEDLVSFASQVNKQQLRGKALERAAQKYCNHLDRVVASPQGATKLSATDLINQLSNHKVVPAGYNPEHGANDSVTGKFMGSSKNPNTIWDTNALQTLAQASKDDSRKFGDEEIAKSKTAQAEYKDSMNAQPELTDTQKQERNKVMEMNSKVASTATQAKASHNSTLPANAMSIFSDNRDFEGIPDKTIGEEIIAKAEARANKKVESGDKPRDIQTPMNTRDSLDNLFG